MNVFHLVYVFSRYYLENSIWVNIYTVDSRWLYSLFWCMNVTSVTTNKCHDFSQMTRPVWHMVCKRRTVNFYGKLCGSQMCLLHFPVYICTFIALCIILLLGQGVLVMLLIQYLSASQAKHNDFYYRNESHTWRPSVLWQCWLGSRKRSGMYTDCCMLTTVNWRMQMICTYFGVLVVSHYF